MMSPRTYVIGDIHGCYAKARRLIAACLEFNRDHPFCLIFLGDYVDRGDNSRAVVEWLMGLEEAMPDQVLCLRGNHEDMLVQATATVEAEDHWVVTAGGDATLASYGVERTVDIPVTHRKWIAARPLLYRDEQRLYVHAGIMPGVPLAKQPRDVLLWIRDEFLSSDVDHGLLVVHGHTPIPAGRPELRPNRLNLDTGACFGGPLTAAAFDDTAATPLAFITDNGIVTVLREESISPAA
jgi:diadenosine tetraphosphatase ApaH/serine/threonine PP2A family protein phosphatase